MSLDEPHKMSRHALIEDLRALLFEGEVNSQEAICDVLANKGHDINQSKVSRLLRKIGAVKSKNEKGEIVYHLPFEPAPPTLQSDLASLVIDVVCNESLIIVNTSPGAAQLLARVIDYHKKSLEVLASIAGDDTIFIAPCSTKTIKTTKDAISKLLLC